MADPKPKFTMAKVEFPDYMKGVSGTLNTITFGDGTKRKIIATCSKSGKQRVYIRDYKPRTTKVSEKEKKARSKFAEAAQFYFNLTDEQKEAYRKKWKSSKGRLNFKKYATLRGYIIASFYLGVNPD